MYHPNRLINIKAGASKKMDISMKHYRANNKKQADSTYQTSTSTTHNERGIS